MRVASDPDLGQMHNRYITAPAIYRIPPQPRHCQTHAPTVLTWICDRFRWNIVAVEDRDRNLGQRHELRQRDADRLQRTAGARHRGRHFSFREEETAPGFV